MLKSCQEHLETNILVPTLNLTWLRATVRNTNLVWLCLESDRELNTKIIEDFLRFSTIIYMLSYDQQFRSYDLWNLAVDSEIFVLDRFSFLWCSNFNPSFQGGFQEHLNTKIIRNFLRFSTIIYMLSYDQQFRSYDLWNLAVDSKIFVLDRFKFLRCSNFNPSFQGGFQEHLNTKGVRYFLTLLEST